MSRVAAMLSVSCLPVGPSAEVYEALLQDVLLHRWDWMPDRERQRQKDTW